MKSVPTTTSLLLVFVLNLFLVDVARAGVSNRTTLIPLLVRKSSAPLLLFPFRIDRDRRSDAGNDTDTTDSTFSNTAKAKCDDDTAVPILGIVLASYSPTQVTKRRTSALSMIPASSKTKSTKAFLLSSSSSFSAFTKLFGHRQKKSSKKDSALQRCGAARGILRPYLDQYRHGGGETRSIRSKSDTTMRMSMIRIPVARCKMGKIYNLNVPKASSNTYAKNDKASDDGPSFWEWTDMDIPSLGMITAVV